MLEEKEKTYRLSELEHYFPEEANTPFRVSTVVKHRSHPDSTVGFISGIEDDPMVDTYKALNEVSQRMQQLAGIETSGNSFTAPEFDKVYRVEWSSPPPEDRDPFASFAFPVVRRVNYSQIGQQMFKVQPMTAPKGNIFYLDYKFGVDGVETKERDACEENSQSTSGTALEKSGWGSAIRTFFTRASTGVGQFVKKIVGLVFERIRF